MRFTVLVVSVFGIAALGLFGLAGCTSETEANIQIKLPTVQCGTCVTAVTKALEQIEGVKGVEVDLEQKLAKVTYLAGITDVKKLEQTIAKAGYAANETKADQAAYTALPNCCKIEGAH